MINDSMYKEVYNNIYNHLRSSKYKPVVKPVATGDTYPLVVVENIEISNLVNLHQGMESISFIGIEVNIYAKAVYLDGMNILGVNVSKEIRNIVDEVCTDMFKMRLVTCKPTPNLDNGAIYRLTMRYNAKQNDNRNSFY